MDYETTVGAAPADYTGDPTRSSDPAMIYFTSGTVGYPKMVLHTHASYPIGHIITGKYWLDLRAGRPALERRRQRLGQGGLEQPVRPLEPWARRCSCRTAAASSTPPETLELLGQYPITTFCAPPTVYRTLVLEDLKQYHFPHLRWCVGAGEPLNPEVIEVWQEATGLTIRDGYGQTETVLTGRQLPAAARSSPARWASPRPASMSP